MDMRFMFAVFVILLGAGCTSATTAPATDTTATGETEQQAEENTTSESNVEGVTTKVTIVASGEGAQNTKTPETTVANTTDKTVNVTVTASNFAFAPAAITATAGQMVNVTFVNEEGFHDFVIDGIAASSTLKAGASETVTFTAPKAGTYAYYCSVGEHRTMGMEGTLVVTE